MRTSDCHNHLLLRKFNNTLRSGLSSILNVELDNVQWLRASLSVRNSGTGLRLNDWLNDCFTTHQYTWLVRKRWQIQVSWHQLQQCKHLLTEQSWMQPGLWWKLLLESGIASGLHDRLHGTQHANLKGNLQYCVRTHQSSTSRWTWATCGGPGLVRYAGEMISESRPSRSAEDITLMEKWKDPAKIRNNCYCAIESRRRDRVLKWLPCKSGSHSMLPPI